MRPWVWVVGLCLLGCGATRRGPAAPIRYELDVHSFERATVRACFPGVIVPETLAISTLSRQARGCTAYDVDLRQASLDVQRSAALLWPDVILPIDELLAAPAGREPVGQLKIRVPRGMQVTAPWPRDGEAYRLDWTAFRLDSRLVLSRKASRWQSGPVTVRLVNLGLEIEAARLTSWTEDALRAFRQIYGTFPAAQLQIIVVGTPGAGVGFGMTIRGGGPAVIVWVGRSTSAASFADDWTLTHELIHLGMPRLKRGDEWFSEGVTSYLTYVGRARARLMPAVDAWSALHDGFVRGRRTRTGRALAAESAAMSETGGYWPVYWGGAAWALAADRQLRARGHTLDAAIARWQRMGHLGRWYPAETLLGTADESFRDAGLRALAESFLEAEPLPEARLAELYRALGLRRIDDKHVGLVEGPDSAIRDAIMRPR